MKVLYKILQRPNSLNTHSSYFRADYVVTYKNELNTININELDICEYLFELFNIRHPENFGSRSLSVGDAIELTFFDEFNKRVVYQCKGMGFEEVYRSINEPF